MADSGHEDGQPEVAHIVSIDVVWVVLLSNL